ncbi:hypothetical protein BDR05DRAFT_1000306 [Suillus weaverae]|nr:hypothetical protein BDR05DRAFT_1000306 [Suillus weaverae]
MCSPDVPSQIYEAISTIRYSATTVILAYGAPGGVFMRGPSLSMIEVTAVVPEGCITPDDAELWKDSQIEPLPGSFQRHLLGT